MAILSVHRALRQPGSLILHVGPTQRQSGELLAKARELLWQLNVPYRGDGRNSQSACLPNGSRIVALPAAPHRIRGFSGPAMIVIDEAAQVSDELYRTVKPMLLPSAGDLWVVSTPYGKRGFFWDLWSRGGDDWNRFSARASECPRFDPAQLERQRHGLTDAYFRQEFECEFVDPDEALFPTDLILRAITNEVEPMWIWS